MARPEGCLKAVPYEKTQHSMKPRVLVVTTYYHPVLGGVETHARQIAGHLHARGFGVEVLTKRVGAADPAESEVDGVRVHRVGPTGERSAWGKWLAAPAFFRAMLEGGVYLAPSQFEAGFLSSAHGPAELDLTLRAAEGAFRVAAET